jgi:hypothetical protein
MAHNRPRRAKLYAAMIPIVAIRNAAGIAADGASPNAAIPDNVNSLYNENIMINEMKRGRLVIRGST